MGVVVSHHGMLRDTRASLSSPLCAFLSNQAARYRAANDANELYAAVLFTCEPRIATNCAPRPTRRFATRRTFGSQAETRSRDHTIVGPTPSNACSSFSPYQPCFLQSEIRVDHGLQLDPIGSWLIAHFTIHGDTRLAVGVEDRPKVNVVQSNDS